MKNISLVLRLIGTSHASPGAGILFRKVLLAWAGGKKKTMGEEQEKYPRPELGSWHTITEYAVKTHPSYNNATVWRVAPIDNYLPERGKWVYEGEKNSPPLVAWRNDWKYERTKLVECRAMYIGYRYKKNGYAHWNADFEGEYMFGFSQHGTVEVWMFVVYESRNPIPVFPFQVNGKSKKKG